MKRIGPELKLSALKTSDLKLPPFFADLYYDLRKRGLLPIVVLILVAIVAVPFLLGGGSEEEEPATLSTAGPSAAEASRFTVVEAKPGLRNYHKRLAHRKATDPFHQRYTAPQLAGTQLPPPPGESSSTGGPSFSTTTTTETSSSTTVESSTPESSTPGGSGGGTKPEGGGEGKESGLRFYAFAIDVRISKAQPPKEGSTAKGKSEPDVVVKQSVLPQTRLPGDKSPVVTYMGPSKSGEALFLVSAEVKSVFGEAKCVSGDSACQLLEVDPEFPVTFVYGPGETRYTFHVLKMQPVPVGHS
jgi:hypothetical protein